MVQVIQADPNSDRAPPDVHPPDMPRLGEWFWESLSSDGNAARRHSLLTPDSRQAADLILRAHELRAVQDQNAILLRLAQAVERLSSVAEFAASHAERR